MSMSDERIPIYQLIIRQRPAASPELDSLVQLLQEDFGLDPYTARQRLIPLRPGGSGKSQKDGGKTNGTVHGISLSVRRSYRI